MKGDYPHFKADYNYQELTEYFALNAAERAFVGEFRGDANRNGVAVLLKALDYLGYFPEAFAQVPTSVRAFIAQQLGLLWDHTEQYAWHSGTKDNHLALIRRHTGFRFATGQDKQALERWLRTEGAQAAPRGADLLEAAYTRLRSLRIELPAEKGLRRIVDAALNGFFQDIYARVARRLSAGVRETLDRILIVAPEASLSGFDSLKDDPSRAGVDNLEKEVGKLQRLRALGIAAESVADVPFTALQMLKRRARNENAAHMRGHPAEIRYTLLAAFAHVRAIEVIDDIVRMMLEMIHRMDVCTENQIYRELLQDIKRVEGKMQILFRVAEAVVEEPDGVVRDVLFSRVKEETFQQLVAEYRTSGAQYRLIHQKVMRQRFARHYRRMLPLVLENITFRSDNRFQPVIEALGIIKRYLGTGYQIFPEAVPIEGVVTRGWVDAVIERVGDKTKVNRQYYELCVLQKLERALKCKEIWVEGSYAFRNPSEDMPTQWHDEDKRADFYGSLNQPMQAKEFTQRLRQRLTAALGDFNRRLPQALHLKIYFPGSNQERGLFSLARLEAQPEPHSLVRIKDAIGRQWGMLDLLDVFVEADRRVGFTRFFTHSGIKEVRSREFLRPLIILALFGEGTNTGIKRVAKANHQYSYDELLYVRKNYFSSEALRDANGAVVNAILQLRNPRIWGEGHTCASDGKRFECWSQNLMTEWRSRYQGHGVLVYWHVETNAVCIYSQLRSFSSSEVAAMIEGLIRHDTEMRVEKNFVDSHGQSEIAFAFCHLLGSFRLMPRLKRIKYERLYRPDTGTAESFPNLAGVLTRPIRWDLMEQQYDEMVKATVAMKHGYASAESVLKRFNSYNVVHPTYKALAELGKAEKTIFLCEYLLSRGTQYEVEEGLNVVERWNGTNDFIRYGNQGVLATNSREHQEISTLSLQLLQNCLMLINTILVERTIEQQGMLDRLSTEDLRALTPLFYEHINPYGIFAIDLDQPSFLEAA